MPELIDAACAYDLVEKLYALHARGLLSSRELDWLQSALAAVTIVETQRDRNRFRNHWVAADFHTRVGEQHREKNVAKTWNLTPRQVATIASRGRAEFERRYEQKYWKGLRFSIASVAEALRAPVVNG